MLQNCCFIVRSQTFLITSLFLARRTVFLYRWCSGRKERQIVRVCLLKTENYNADGKGRLSTQLIQSVINNCWFLSLSWKELWNLTFQSVDLFYRGTQVEGSMGHTWCRISFSILNTKYWKMMSPTIVSMTLLSSVHLRNIVNEAKIYLV